MEAATERAAFRGLVCCPPCFSPQQAAADGIWGKEAGVQKSPECSLPLSTAPPYHLLLLLTLTPTMGAKVQIFLEVTICHFLIRVPVLWGKKKCYLKIALVWLSEWVICKTQTQTVFRNPKAFQDCSLTHLIPYLGLENVPAPTKSHHGVIVSQPENPKNPFI